MRLIVFMSICTIFWAAATSAQANNLYLDSPRNTNTFRFEIDNDAVWQTDSNFSNGWSLQWHSKRFADWDESTAPGWINWVGKNFPTLDRENAIVRSGHGLGQNLITPGDITNPNPDPDDLPYAGTLTYAINWQSFNRDVARIFQVSLGVLGREAYGEEVQRFVHIDLGWGDPPEGWHTQRETEPILNLAYSQSYSLADFGSYTNAWGGHLAVSPSVHLGNLYTAFDLGFAFRFGWNMPEGFEAFPAPPGRGLFTATQLAKPASASPHSVEFSLAGRASALGYSALYDGSLITNDDRDVEREDYFFTGLVGIAYHYYDTLSVRLHFIQSTDLLKEEFLPVPLPGKDKTSEESSYGTFMFDLYF